MHGRVAVRDDLRVAALHLTAADHDDLERALQAAGLTGVTHVEAPRLRAAARDPDRTRGRDALLVDLTQLASPDLVLITSPEVAGLARASRAESGPRLLLADEAAASAALSESRIGLLGTRARALGALEECVRSHASRTGVEVDVVSHRVSGTCSAAWAEDRGMHDRLVRDAAREIAGRVDLLVVAEPRLARLRDELALVTGLQVVTPVDALVAELLAL